LQDQEKRCQQLLQILANGEKSIYQICQEMYPHLKGFAVYLGLSKIQGHLDLLEQRQQVCSLKQGLVMKYRTN